MTETLKQRSPEELVWALRERATFLAPGQEWSVPATVAMMNEAADVISALAGIVCHQDDKQETAQPRKPGQRRNSWGHMWGAEIDGVQRCECGARSDADNYEVCSKSPEHARITKQATAGIVRSSVSPQGERK